MAYKGTISESRSAALLGMALMLLASLLGAVDVIIVRLMSAEVHPFVMGFTRSLFGLLFFLPWLLMHPQCLQSSYRVRHVVRAALKLASLIAFFTAYSLSPLADVTAIAFTSPLFVTIGAWVFLSESPHLVRILAVATGFIGALIVISPGEAGISTGLLLALLGAALTAAIQLILKPMSAKDSTETLLAWNLIITVPIASIPALLVWVTPSPMQWALLVLQGVVGLLAMGLVTRAFALADASLIVPLDFLKLPIVALLAFVMFGQSVSLTTWLGGVLIFVASVLMARSISSRTPVSVAP